MTALAPGSARCLGQEGHGIAEGLDGLGGIVGDLDREFLFEGHHELDLVERIGAQVVDEAGLFGDLLRIDIEVLDDDLPDAISDIGHGTSLSPNQFWLFLADGPEPGRLILDNPRRRPTLGGLFAPGKMIPAAAGRRINIYRSARPAAKIAGIRGVCAKPRKAW